MSVCIVSVLRPGRIPRTWGRLRALGQVDAAVGRPVWSLAVRRARAPFPVPMGA